MTGVFGSWFARGYGTGGTSDHGANDNDAPQPPVNTTEQDWTDKELAELQETIDHLAMTLPADVQEDGASHHKTWGSRTTWVVMRYTFLRVARLMLRDIRSSDVRHLNISVTIMASAPFHPSVVLYEIFSKPKVEIHTFCFPGTMRETFLATTEYTHIRVAERSRINRLVCMHGCTGTGAQRKPLPRWVHHSTCQQPWKGTVTVPHTCCRPTSMIITSVSPTTQTVQR
jgi:hypothetical protein